MAILDIDLMGVVSVEGSGPKELKERAKSLLPGAKSVIVFGKEILKEVVALLKPNKGVGEAAGGEPARAPWGLSQWQIKQRAL